MRYEQFLLSRITLVFIFGIVSLIGLIIWLLLPKHETPKPICGYDSCPKSDPHVLNIHLVPHSHDELGWFDTYDQTYLTYVQYIIDSVIESLQKHPKRRFIYAEVAYLWKWWKRQNETKAQILTKLINEGRFEIINGGWSMNDEATTHYQSIIDQFTWGFRRVEDAFGVCARPKIGWQIDSFGNSREQASIFAQMGFDGIFIGRIDYTDRKIRFEKKTAEFIWKASDSLGKSANIFTSVLYNEYLPPPGFCFDLLCIERVPIIDNHGNLNNNIRKRVEKLLNFAKKQALSYRTNNVLFTMGAPLHYTFAELWFSNMDKLIKYINEKKKNFKIFYSTPSCYLKSLNDANLTWPVKTGDFFPYARNHHTIWTGYYTSRPTLKFFERIGNNFIQIIKQLSVLTNQPDSEDLQIYRETMGVIQHHNAITGTAKMNVISDYIKLLHESIVNGTHIASKTMSILTTKESTPEPIEFYSCLLLNISSCDHTSDNNIFVVTVYNPTSQPLTTFVRIPVQKFFYGVKDFTGNEITTQMVPIPNPVQTIPGRISSATMELVFQADDIAPLGFQSFYIYKKNCNNASKLINESYPLTYSQSIGAEYYNVSVDSQGRIYVYCTKAARDLHIRQSFQYYEAAEGNNAIIANHSSGTNVFRPRQDYSKNIKGTYTYKIFKGPLVEEIHLIVNNWISQVVRMYNGKDLIEFDWLIGPVPTEDNIGKEIITKFSSNVQNRGIFYTDSNGREMIKRRLKQRPRFKLWFVERIAGNYYPVTTKISIEDKRQMLRMSVLTDRSQGGSSLTQGEIQLMMHRRLLSDDELGVDEPLNEMAFGTGLMVKGKHYLIIGSLTDRNELILQEKEEAIGMALRPWFFITPTKLSYEKWNKYYKMKGGGVTKNIPNNVRILTLEPWKDGEILLRLEHIFGIGETPKYSTTVKIDLKTLFIDFTIQKVREMTLGANKNLEDVKKLKWTLETEDPLKVDIKFNTLLQINDSISIQLEPMQIRTFILKISWKNKE